MALPTDRSTPNAGRTAKSAGSMDRTGMPTGESEAAKCGRSTSANDCQRSWKMRKTLYIIHLHQSLGTHRHRARHYIGRTKNIDQRLKAHRYGYSRAKFMRAVFERKIAWNAYIIGEGTAEDEKRLKANGHYERWCPLCRRLRADLRAVKQPTDPRELPF